MESDNQIIVIENGSSLCKFGFSGDDKPFTFPSVIGTPKYPEIYMNMHGGSEPRFIGEQAIQKRGVLQLKFPVERGHITDYEMMKLVWDKCYKNEKFEDEKTQVNTLLTETMCENRFDREKQAEIFFEQFEVPGFYLSNSTKLALYGAGKTSGLSVHSGDQVTQYIVCYDGNMIDNGILDTFISGKDVTMYLKSLLFNELKIDMSSSAQLQIVKNLKEKACYVSLDPQNDEKKWIETTVKNDKRQSIEFKLPDESIIHLSKQSFMSPQIMFNPKMIGQDTLGMHQNIIEIANRVEQSEIQKIMFSNIVLSGGNTMFRNFAQRLTNQLKERVPQNEIIKVIAPLERSVLSWIGGSILTALSTFEDEWITKAEYEEFGPNIVHKKFPL